MMLHKIYFSVCGEGYGHSSRDLAIAGEVAVAGACVYREKAAQYSGMSKIMKGSQKASKIILELSNRMQCY